DVDRGGVGRESVRPGPEAGVAGPERAARVDRPRRCDRGALQRPIARPWRRSRGDADGTQPRLAAGRGGGGAAPLPHLRGGALRRPRRRRRARAMAAARPAGALSAWADGGPSAPPRARRLAAAGHARPALVPRRPLRPDLPRLRDAGLERRLLVPPLEQGLLPRARRHRPSGASRLFRRGAGLTGRLIAYPR